MYSAIASAVLGLVTPFASNTADLGMEAALERIESFLTAKSFSSKIYVKGLTFVPFKLVESRSLVGS